MNCEKYTGRLRAICERNVARAKKGRKRSRVSAAIDLSCAHRGDVLRVEKCELCGHKHESVEIHACALHGECSLRRYKAGNGPRACLTCQDRSAP